MRLRSLILPSLAVLLPVLAQAQIAVYGMFQANRLSGISYRSTVSSGNNGNFSPLGGTLGVFYDFRSIGPVRIGADVRGSLSTTKKGADPTSIGAGGRIGSAMGGVRAVFKTPIAPLKPYVEGLVGVARTNYGTDYFQQILPVDSTRAVPGVTLSTALQYQALAGLDVAIVPALDLRIIELGFGGLSGSGTHSGNYPLKSVGIGLVFHFPVQ